MSTSINKLTLLDELGSQAVKNSRREVYSPLQQLSDIGTTINPYLQPPHTRTLTLTSIVLLLIWFRDILQLCEQTIHSSPVPEVV